MIELALAVCLWAMADSEMNGPTEIPAGRLAIFSVSVPAEGQATWKVFCPESSGLAQEDVAVVVENHQRLIFASPFPGKYIIVVAVAGNNRLDLWDHVLVVTAPSPPPEPGPGPEPNPGPGPGPSPPDLQWSDWAKRTADATVRRPFRDEEGTRIASAFRKVAERVVKGEITDERSAREMLRREVRAALGSLEAITRWKAFSDALDEKLDSVSSEGIKLTDYVRLWTAIADGLEK